MGKTSKERSHSKISNFKLTLIALIAIIGFNAIFVGLIFFKYNMPLSIGIMAGASIITIFSYFLITRFTR